MECRVCNFDPKVLNREFLSQTSVYIGNSFETDLLFDVVGFSFHMVDLHEMCLALSYIKHNACGIDGLSLRFIKQMLYFTNILTYSFYPGQWKVTKVVPIGKKTRVVGMNYLRLISIPSVFSKVVEPVAQEQLIDHSESKNLISPFQCGSRKNYDASAVLLGLTDTIRSNPNNDLVIVLISLDLYL